MKLYTLLAAIFYLMRQFAIPNPFEALGTGLNIRIGARNLLLTPEILNWAADPIIYLLTFAVVGLYYRRGTAPVLGSCLYMVFYCIHIGLLYLILSCYPMIWLMITIAIVYIALHISLIVLKNRLSWWTY